MEISWIRTFIIAAQNENFRKTSEALFLTQPAITKHIRRLEERLNTVLFERVGKSVSLTPAGAKFLPYAKEMLEKYDQGIDNFEAWKQGYNKKLIIAAAPQIASSILPSLLRRFIDEHPDIEVIISVLKSYEIGEGISLGRADIGLTKLQPLQTNITSEVVHEERVLFVGPHLEEETLGEEATLEKYRLITHNHPDYWELLLHEVRRHYPSTRTMAVDQVEITKRFIEAGLGVSYLPLTMVEGEIRTDKLVEIQPEKINVPSAKTYVVTKVKTQEVIIFTSFLKEAIQKNFHVQINI
ncbi:LysR family transcriptional regulator [Bacillus solitudinis]|uniref:LysR family transcriptional regulator n=1 Tax=Bacillus solitudinis TaxID=2014074 RepID=UPI000C246660|nr:LysR family transcriptional regulator [Bacillus solitudinis]